MTHVVSLMDVDREGEGLRQSDWIDARVLAAGVVESFQAPTVAKRVLFSGNGNFYCRITPAANGSAVAAAVPAADVTDGSASELNPAMRVLPDDTAYISLIAPTDTIVTMIFYH